jgi:hypothetical protein
MKKPDLTLEQVLQLAERYMKEETIDLFIFLPLLRHTTVAKCRIRK